MVIALENHWWQIISSGKNNKMFCSASIGGKIILAMLVLLISGYSAGKWWQTLTPPQVLGVTTATHLDTNTIVNLLNLERAKHALGALTPQEQLTQAALDKGKFMLEHNYWAHVSPDGVEPWQFIQQQNYFYLSAGENLARDFTNEKDLVAAWMASPTHRANILNGNFSQLGVGVVEGMIGKQPIVLIVCFYAQPHTHQSSLPQLSRYNSNTGELVLAGEVVSGNAPPATTITGGELKYLPLMLAAGIILTAILIKFKQQPYGRRGKRKKYHDS